jgi:MOSC domain-containing protein YiiM
VSSSSIRHLFVSDGHNYFGHHGRAPGTFPARDVAAVTVRAGRGIEGDRFFGYRDDYKGQVTFFAWETYEAAKHHFAVPSLNVGAVRRNVITEGIDLPSLIGVKFRLGDVEFFGTEESRPCYWMNDAVAPGAEAWLRGNGGLRARVLSDGELRVGPVTFAITGGQALLAV